MSSITMSSARVIRAMVLATDPSTVARPIAAVRVSRVNQETRIPASMTLCASASTKCVFPVPEVTPTDCNIFVPFCRAR